MLNRGSVLLSFDCLEGWLLWGRRGLTRLGCQLLGDEPSCLELLDGYWGWALGGAGRGNRTANRVSVSSGKNDLKRLAGSGFRGFNILEDVTYRNAPSGAGADRNTTTAGVPVYKGSSMGATPPKRVGTAKRPGWEFRV